MVTLLNSYYGGVYYNKKLENGKDWIELNETEATDTHVNEREISNSRAFFLANNSRIIILQISQQ